MPASFTTHPSGARLPRRIARPPCGLIGSARRADDHLAGGLLGVRRLLADGAAGHREGVGVQDTRVGEALRDHADAAGLVEVGGDEPAAGLQVCDQGGRAGDPLEVVDVHLHPRLARDREQVEHAVRRAAGGADGRDRVLDRLGGDDLLGRRSSLSALTASLPASRGDLRLVAVHRRDHRGAHRRDAHRLERAGHRVGGELAAAGTRRRGSRSPRAPAGRRRRCCPPRGLRSPRRRPGSSRPSRASGQERWTRRRASPRGRPGAPAPSPRRESSCRTRTSPTTASNW